MKVAQYKGVVYTLDTIEAIKVLEQKNKTHDFCEEISYSSDKAVWETRRCVTIQGNLKKIWSFAIPLGFTPWNRYPVPGDTDSLFYFYGPWEPMMDRLMAMGRGDVVWDSFIVASCLEAGTWDKENKFIEHSVQMQLHRLGYNPGPIDGVIGKLTLRALNEAGVKERLDLALQRLQMKKIQTSIKSKKPRFGEVSFPGSTAQIQTYGDIRVVREEEGAQIEILGKGRLIIDF